MEKVEAFLKSIGFIQTWEEMRPVEEAFLASMQRGLDGEANGMPMLPSYLDIDALAAEGRDVIVLDAGGTNLRVSVLRLSFGQKPQVLYHHKQPMPGKAERLTRDAFFDELAQAVAPVAVQSDRIGFCFSFPCRIHANLDGEILYLDKEIEVEGIEGAMVADGLRQALARLGVKHDHRIVILNDAVATLLGALAEHPARHYSGHIGIILGTGTNCCYVEANERIRKDSSLCARSGHTVINMETGAFNGMELTAVDHLVDRCGKNPQRNLMEKMVSGEYQGHLMDALISCAIEAGCLSTEVKRRFAALETGLSTADISLYMQAPTQAGRLHALAPDGEDAHALYALVDALLERAAMLVVMNLTSIMRFTGAGRDPLRPVLVAVEGTTFAKNECFRQKILGYLLSYTQRQRGFHCRVTSTEEANLVGSAIAATTL